MLVCSASVGEGNDYGEEGFLHISLVDLESQLEKQWSWVKYFFLVKVFAVGGKKKEYTSGKVRTVHLSIHCQWEEWKWVE